MWHGQNNNIKIKSHHACACSIATVVSNSMGPYALKPARLLVHGDSPGASSYQVLKKRSIKKKKKRSITELLKVHGISISLVKQESGSVHGFSGSESHGEVAAWQNQLQLPILSDHLTTLCQALG